MEWSKVFAAGLQTLMICLASNHQGGAATVNGKLHLRLRYCRKGVSLIAWASPKTTWVPQDFRYLCGRMEHRLIGR